MQESIAIGVDIGGSHISAAPVDLNCGNVIQKGFIRGTVNAHGSCDEILNQWAFAIQQCCAAIPAQKQRIGIAMPGPFDYENGISLIHNLDKYEALYGLNIKQLLAAKLGITPMQIRMINDASAFLLGEVKAGAATNAERVIGLTLGTGLGSAFYDSGKIIDGDLYCTQFKGGRAEDILCSRWFVNSYAEKRGARVKGVKDLVERAENDPFVMSLFESFGSNLAQLLHQRFDDLHTYTVVIGGNVAHSWDLFVPAFTSYCQQNQQGFPVHKAVLGEIASMIGAACLWQ